MTEPGHVWNYRGHRLQLVEWGLWKDLGDPRRFFLCFRPEGKRGPIYRRWASLVPGKLSLADLRNYVREIHGRTQAARLGMDLARGTAETLDEYLSELERRGRTPIYTTDVRAVIARFIKPDEGSGLPRLLMLREIDVPAIEQFLSYLHTIGSTARTQNKYRDAIASWLTWAVRRRYLRENPAALVEHASGTQKLVDFLMPDELLTIVQVSPPEYGRLWAFITCTGLRRESVLCLTPECFRDDGILVRHTKRQVEWLLSFDDGCPLWAPDLSALGRQIWNHHPPTLRYLRDGLQALEDKGHKFTLHGLRHSFASWLTMMGERDSDISAWLHHSTGAMLRRYVHLRPRGLDRIAENRKKVFTLRSQIMGLLLEEEAKSLVV